MLRVVHPSQAEAAEREYLLARFRSDWASLTSALLATHSLPTALNGKNLLVLCDHNTFANELSMIAPAVEKKIVGNYNVTIKIHARASKRMDWQKMEDKTPQESGFVEIPLKRRKEPMPFVDELISRLENI